MKSNPHIESREKQEVPSEIVQDLLQAIRGQFYGDLPPDAFPKDRRFLVRVVTWPAARLTRQGVTLPAARYKAIFLTILDGIKAHGATSAIRYWPGYLLRCVQEHWRHHGDEYYEEGKIARSLVERAMRSIPSPGGPDGAAARPGQDPVAALAEVASILRPGKRQTRPKPVRGKGASQLDLFG